MTVRTDDPRPPYLQVAADLRASIASGVFAPGGRLPSGRELARRYGVALMTMQKALALLRDEGLVVSYQGRGVFVCSPGSESAVPASPEFVAIMGEITALRESMEQTTRRLEERLSRLEQAPAATKPRPSKRVR
jgi:DNA-binding GntR family transcriptional regulator